MKKNVKYYFNPETLSYEHSKNHRIEKFFRIAGLLASFSLVVVLIISISVYRTKSPDEKMLRQELSFYKEQLGKLNNKYENVNNALAELQKKDNEVYRVIFEADPLPDDVLNAATGGTEKYKDLEGFDASAAIITANHKLDGMSAKLSVLDQSYKELMKLADQKKKMLSTLPAIQPVSDKDLTEIASGFGMRIHPIYHTLHMHEGLDFAAPRGTKVYATGDGVVERVEFNGRGLGNFIVINHGFGYETIYGHLSKQLVRPGQKVKRGSVIGLVGSTGLSTAPHLHYEVAKGGQKVNPVNYFHNDLKPADYEKLVKLANKANKSFD